ncbi:MAG: tRNA 2-thiouridine(34) synthase MnmA [Sedimentisphaerales bacterium]|nr:tRNA 2-thiouridine(34) synthase MnmA [Sedimentisphaerales bacterium]
MSKSVLVAMSGGVDSSVAAALLLQQGYRVVGVFMCLGFADQTFSHQGCCSPQDARDAKEVANQLGIQFHVMDFQNEIEEVITYFVDEYRRGRTPNPCIMCNTHLKFGKLFEYANACNLNYVATGHYAQIIDTDQRESPTGNRAESQVGHKALCRGLDAGKDQSYALFGIERNRLQRILLPIGQYHKEQVRQLARQMQLPVHDKGESQEICFVPDDDYAGLIAQRAPDIVQPGKVIDTSGKVLGEHQGVFHYTIGQRKGLGIALGEPAYVVKLDAQTNTVVLGSCDDLFSRHLRATNVNWLIPPADLHQAPFDATVQIRYNHRGAPAKVQPVLNAQGYPDTVEIEFTDPISAITPGQAAVIYQNNQLLGGGWINNR